jgi:hypothetical protein
MFWKKKNSPQITREQALDALVIPNGLVRPQESEKGDITLVIPYQAPAWIQRLSRSVGAGAGERTIALDEVGSFVWRMCDGRTSVREMIERLADRYKLNRKESAASLTAFVRTLAAKGLVTLVVRKSGS